MLVAEPVGDGVTSRDARDVYGRILNDDAVLDIDTANFDKRPCCCTVRGNELGHDGEGFARVDSEARAEEGLVTHAPRVIIAAVFVAWSRVST